MRFVAAHPGVAALLAAALFFACQGASAELSHAQDSVAGSQFPSLFDRLRPEEPIDYCSERVPLERQEVRERLEKELLLTMWDRPQVVLWIKRSPRYLPIIESKLREAGMPDDLKYVAIAESALRPHAGSNKGAIGYWQFLASTGRKYGLQVDSEKDERRNIFRSTEAAIAYLKELHGLFASWTLATAAYNMGEQGLQSEILAQRHSDYYNLYLPLETQRYIFRILAAKLILTNPGRYGFVFDSGDLYPPLRFDRSVVECFEPTPIHLVAEAAATHFKAIKDLNPELRGHFLAAGVHDILVPLGAAKGFQARFKKLSDQWAAQKEQRVYVVKEGDTLTGIAERFEIPLNVLIIWNRLESRKYIHPGDRLVIYAPEVDTGDLPEE